VTVWRFRGEAICGVFERERERRAMCAGPDAATLADGMVDKWFG
jgi:hypothetical protein